MHFAKPADIEFSTKEGTTVGKTAGEATDGETVCREYVELIRQQDVL